MTRMEAISHEIFSQVRTTIVLNMRFMDMAVFRLKPAVAPVTLATDGEFLYYSPDWLLNRYRDEANAVTRDYLHVLMHCVFRHPFVGTLVDRRKWDLACDIAVEGLICELNQSHFATRSEERRKAIVDGLRQQVRPLTAEKLYHWFQDHAPQPGWEALFRADDHAIWHNPSQAQQMSREARQQGGEGEPNPQPSKPQQQDEQDGQDQNSQNQPSDGDSRDQNAQNQSSDGDSQDQSSQNQSSDGNSQDQNSQNQSSDGDGQDQNDQNQPSDGDGQGVNDQNQPSEGDSQDQSSQNQSSDGNGQDQSGQNQSSDGNGQGQSGQPSQGGSDGRNGSDGAQAPSSGMGTQAGAGRQRFSPRPGQGGGGRMEDAPVDAAARQALESEWRDISEHVQMDLETFAKQQGLVAGGMQQMLAELNREKYDYEAFLKKFAVMGEVMHISADEFDYVYYTYGLKLFKNMPLIEPLEYREEKRIREFVIAIDTSGSTSGELVNRFLTKTYNILMSTQSFFSKVNIHIVQCDAAVQEAVKITCREEFEQYIRHMTIRGLGGTDFRPVFAYVDQLLRQHEFQRLRGMIYFTDGYGTFPERKPEYTTAFVFIQDEYNNLNVPPWAIRLILEKEEL